MILIGQYDSPFVRRVGITLHHYGLSFEHRPWSVWGDAEKIAHYNPLLRVPTLVLDDGAALVETFAIIDLLDELVGPARALLPTSGTRRRDGLRVAGLCAGIADKAVALLYASLGLTEPAANFRTRCQAQVEGAFALLERERAARSTPFWFGDSLSHADIALGCACRFVRETSPALFSEANFPALFAQAERCEALPEFQRVYLPITNNLNPA